MRLLAGLLLLVATPAAAQILPMPDPADPRAGTLVLPTEGVGRLTILPSSGLDLMMPAGERIDTVVLGDPSAFSARVDGSATTLTIRPLRAEARSTLSLMTSVRPYYFELEANEGPLAASRVRLAPVLTLTPLGGSIAIDMAGAVSEASVPAATFVTYKLSGDRSLRPVRVDDDGQRTTIEWAEGQALPATFGIGPTGDEEVADGHMRDGLYVLDRVWAELVFRIDNIKAGARRRVRRVGR